MSGRWLTLLKTSRNSETPWGRPTEPTEPPSVGSVGTLASVIENIGARPAHLERRINAYLCAHPPRATHREDGCVHCGKNVATTDGMPVLAEGAGHTWVHASCWRDWYAARRAQASECVLRAGGVNATKAGVVDE